MNNNFFVEKKVKSVALLLVSIPCHVRRMAFCISTIEPMDIGVVKGMLNKVSSRTTSCMTAMSVSTEYSAPV